MKGSGHKGKQKFKVKEMYLTKLLSTKVSCRGPIWRLVLGLLNFARRKKKFKQKLCKLPMHYQMLDKKPVQITLLTTDCDHLQR